MNDQLTDHYKRYPDLFLEEYLGIKLYWYQKVFLRGMASFKPSDIRTTEDRLKLNYDAQNCVYDGNVRCIYAYGEQCMIKEVRNKYNCVIAERLGF